MKVFKQLPALLLLVVGLAVASTATAADLQDGPYVSQSSDGAWIARWVEGEQDAPHVREQRVNIGGEVTVPAVGEVPAFRVKLRKPATNSPAEVKLPASTPLFVMADTHGELEIAVELLMRQKVIDPKLAWAFGKGHLVVLGDIFDRGPHQTEILWLLYKLEGEAQRAGGAVHVLVGNHELLALAGQERYLNPRYLKVRDALKARSYAALWDDRTLLGQWLRTRAAVMKVGDFLCMHGGISPEVVRRRLTIAEMNESVRAALGEPQPDGFVVGPEGPLWYRGYFPEVARETGSPVATAAEVEEILQLYGVKAVLVGHTRVPAVTSLYGGKVVGVQVYPHRDSATGRPVMEALRIEQGARFRARADGTREPLSP